MPDLAAPLDMGLAEFCATLIAELFEAVAASTADQDQRHRDMVNAASLTPEEYAKRFVTRQQVEAELARLFPPGQRGHASAVYPKAPYRPPSPDQPEEPAIAAAIGLELKPGDFAKDAKGITAFTRGGAAKIDRALSLRLARSRIEYLQALLARGVQRVAVDSGRVNAKLAFQAVRVGGLPPEVRLAAPLKPLGDLPGGGLPPGLPQGLSEVRLLVHQADAREQSSILGEVEITFKTIA